MQNETILTSKSDLSKYVSSLFVICTTLSEAALDEFSRLVWLEGGKTIPRKYVMKHIIPSLIGDHTIYESSPKHYTVSWKKEQKSHHGLDAFWVFMQHMEGAQLLSLMRGPRPSTITYIKNNRIYHIVCCDGSGVVEMGMAVQLEIETEQRRRGGPADRVEERFIFVFDSKEFAEKAPFKLKSTSLFAVIANDSPSGKPSISYLQI